MEKGLPGFSIPIVVTFLDTRNFCRCACLSRQWAIFVRQKLNEIREDSSRARLQISPGERANVDQGLFEAVDNGDVNAVKEMLRKGASVQASQHIGVLRQNVTALMLAAKQGYLDVTELLISRGSEVDSKSDWGYTPLVWACRHGHKNIVKILIAVGASIETRDTSESTVLMWACMYPCSESLGIVQILIEKGANVNAKNTNNDTAMYFALYSNQISIVKTLISSGAETDFVCNWGSALDVAERQGYSDMALILRQSGVTNSRERLWDPSRH